MILIKDLSLFAIDPAALAFMLETLQWQVEVTGTDAPDIAYRDRCQHTALLAGYCSYWQKLKPWYDVGHCPIN
jgi:hypothetical protein